MLCLAAFAQTPKYCLKKDISYAIQFYISGEYTYNFDSKLDIKEINFSSSNTKKDDEKTIKNNLLKSKNTTISKIRIKQDIFLEKSR